MTAFAHFPYEIVETSGESALATWEELKKAGRGAPVVLGDDLENLLFPFDPTDRARLTPIEDILAAAEAIKFPADLHQLRRDEYAEAMVYLGQIASLADFKNEECEAPLGDWPAETSYGSGLSVAYDTLTGQPRSPVHIALIPTDDPTAIPAYMQWGNFNQCPAAAYHVAALRAWRDHYGAELIGLGADTINLRVSRKPTTREEALELARTQYFYCNDIIDQGMGSYRKLAAGLMASDWWFFWWD
ncbi:DUF4253 domain-containing protein [Methylocapsa sp. S129]|uniref:DUF4253 domain-containing protein n=1 Tax=Methylocapsa sp. S129 TaxID=1641869 RepID=UPI00131C5F59|nr:DUF4253 domain-containing protein [Methylocapsa sp. S129]